MTIEEAPTFRQALASFVYDAFACYERSGVHWEEWLHHSESFERAVLRPLKRFSRQKPGHSFAGDWKVLSTPLKEWGPKESNAFDSIAKRYQENVHVLESLVRYYSFELGYIPSSAVDDARNKVWFRSVFKKDVSASLPLVIESLFDEPVLTWLRTSYAMQQLPSVHVLEQLKSNSLPENTLGMEFLCDPL